MDMQIDNGKSQLRKIKADTHTVQKPYQGGDGGAAGRVERLCKTACKTHVKYPCKTHVNSYMVISVISRAISLITSISGWCLALWSYGLVTPLSCTDTSETHSLSLNLQHGRRLLSYVTCRIPTHVVGTAAATPESAKTIGGDRTTTQIEY